MSTTSLTAPINALADSTGTFVMLAIDQRESLRAMMTAKTGQKVPDSALIDFKVKAAKTLTPFASAVLVDRLYGLAAARASSCPLILAADVLHQEPGGPVTGASLDTKVTAELVEEVGAAALKMLVPWRPDASREAVDLAAEFMQLCKLVGMPGIVEGVVRPADIAQWSDSRRDEAIIMAAQDLAVVKPDLYKAEVPSYGRGDRAATTAVSRHITNVLDCPWVVLSSGVSPADFPSAVAACRSGGASGFLAGRAVWADAVAVDDVDKFLATESVRRMQTLGEVARPNQMFGHDADGSVL